MPAQAALKVEERTECHKCVDWLMRLGKDNSAAGNRCNDKKGCTF